MKKLMVGQKVTTHQNNIGTIIRVCGVPKNKPYVVELYEPKDSFRGIQYKGYYHENQLTVIK